MVHHLMVRYIVSIRHFMTFFDTFYSNSEESTCERCCHALRDQDPRVALLEGLQGVAPVLLVVLAVQHLRVLGSEVLKVCLMMCTHIRECF